MIIKEGNVIFILNPTDTDENGNLTELSVIHAQMVEDFKDNSKLEYFKQLLREDHNTAFLKYNNLI